MNSLMYVKVRDSCKAFSTISTLERFVLLAIMSSQMSSKSCALCKTLSAVFTLVGLLPSVNSLMDPQSSCITEKFATDVTLTAPTLLLVIMMI